MDAVVDAGMPARWNQVSSFFFLVTKVFGFIISKYRGLCEGVVCVLFVWMIGGVCYVVGVVCLGTWGLFEGKVVKVKVVRELHLSVVLEYEKMCPVNSPGCHCAQPLGTCRFFPVRVVGVMSATGHLWVTEALRIGGA